MFRRAKLKSSLQLGPLDCGPANLRALCLNAGVRVDNERVRSLCDTTRAGSSLFRLHEAAETLGFHARLRSLDLYDLRDHAETYLPVIVALQTGAPLHHFVTLHRFRRDRVVVMDPAFGVREMAFDEVLARTVVSELPYRSHDVKSEEQSAENREELLGKLALHGIPAVQASAWLDRHSFFFVDDCLKYVELIGSRREGKGLGSNRDILVAILENESYRLPDQFGTIIRFDDEKSVAVVAGPVVLEIKGQPREEFAALEKRGPKRRLLSHLWGQRRSWAPQAVLSACLALLGIALASSTGLIIESLDSGWPPFVVLLFALGVAQIVSDYARYANARSMARLTNSLALRAKAGLLQRLNAAPERRLRDRTTGELVARVEESAGLASFLSEWGIGTAVALGTGIIAIVLIAYTFWPFLVVVAVQIAIATLIVELFSRRLRRLARDVFEQATVYNAKLLEILRGLEAVRLVRAGNYVFYDADRLASRMARSSFRQQDWLIVQQLVLAVSGVGATIAMALSAYWALSSGAASAAAITSAFALTSLMHGSLSNLLRRRQALESTGVALERYEELTAEDTEPRVDMARGEPVAVRDWNRIELSGVVFGYRRDRQVLRGIDFSFGRGETICILGPSGTGKSTLFDVLTGLYEMEAGEVRADGDALSRADLQQLGAAVVHQEPALIHGSLMENIAFGKPAPLEIKIARAAKAAGVQSVIDRLPSGWDTKVGGRWSSLSGGERRRVCLCRALVREPKLLLLDETLGALEPELRRAIVAELRAFDPLMTIVMITHDPMDASFCSRAVVMSGGLIVEDGPASELLDNSQSRLHRLARGGSLDT